MTPPKGWTRIAGKTQWGYHAWWQPKKQSQLRLPFLVEWELKYYICDYAKFCEGHHGQGIFRIENSQLLGPIETLEAAIAAYHLITDTVPTH